MDRDLKDRTKKFALEIIKLVSELPKTTVAFELGKQLVRSGTSGVQIIVPLSEDAHGLSLFQNYPLSKKRLINLRFDWN